MFILEVVITQRKWLCNQWCYDSAVKVNMHTQQTMPSAIFSLNVKMGYATTWDAYLFLQMIIQPFLYENLTNNQLSKPRASTMQMQKCMNMPKIKYFCIFEINDM